MLEYIATIDIGITAHSIALFDANEKFITKMDFSEVATLIKNYKLSTTNTFAIVSSVKDSNLQDIPFKHQLSRRLLLHGKFNEMPVHYEEKIHDVRLVNGYFLFKQNTKKKMIIDCGNIVTIDVVDQAGFQGGFILPGMTYLKNLFRFDEYFKHFVDEEYIFEYKNELPNDNLTAIEQGTLANFYFSTKALIKQYQPEVIYMTGNHGEHLAKFLKPTCEKSNISIQYSRDLTHRSLCFIAKRVHR